MSRFITSFAFALACTGLAVHAQETTTKTETKSSGGQPQVVTYTGCVQTGTQAKTYVLDKVVPVTKTTTTETPTSSTTTQSTSYILVPGEVQVQQHVGHKVEVTGMLIPGGDSKVETTTRVDREDAPDSKTRERVETKRQRLAAAGQLVEAAAAHQLHDIERATIRQRPAIVDRHDARMIEPRQDVRLARQPIGTGAAAIGDVEHLDGDLALQHVVARNVDGAHAAPAGHAGDLIAGIQLRPGGGLA